MGILGSFNKAEIGPFFRKDVQHGKNELSDQLLATLDFLNDSWNEFQNVLKTSLRGMSIFKTEDMEYPVCVSKK